MILQSQNRQHHVETNQLRHISASLRYVYRHFRLLAMYLTIIFLAGVSLAINLLQSPTSSNDSLNPVSKSSPIEPSYTTATGGPAMTQDSKIELNERTTLTSVTANDNGTTFSVNGSLQTILPNQSFQQSYNSEQNGTKTQTQISIDDSTSATNSSSTSYRSISLQSHSSTNASVAP